MNIPSLRVGALSVAIAPLAVLAQTTPIPLTNWDIENNTTPQFGSIAGWSPNGGWALHSGFMRPGNESLGNNFGFYSAGTTETVGQLTGHMILPDTIYRFWSFAQGGGNNTGTLPYQIGYAAVDGNLASFVELATATYEMGEPWIERDGVTWVSPLSGDPIGRELIVRLGGAAAGGANDIWFDNFQATYEPVPEPATLGVLAAGLIPFLRRRKKK